MFVSCVVLHTGKGLRLLIITEVYPTLGLTLAPDKSRRSRHVFPRKELNTTELIAGIWRQSSTKNRNQSDHRTEATTLFPLFVLTEHDNNTINLIDKLGGYWHGFWIKMAYLIKNKHKTQCNSATHKHLFQKQIFSLLIATLFTAIGINLSTANSPSYPETLSQLCLLQSMA